MKENLIPRELIRKQIKIRSELIMKKFILILVTLILTVNVTSYGASKKKTVTQTSPQSIAEKFLNGFWKAYGEHVDYGPDYDYDSGEDVPRNRWVYKNNSVTQRYKNEYRKKMIIQAQVSSSPNCDGVCSGYPIIGDNGDPYQGPFRATDYNSKTGYVTLKPVPSKIGKMYSESIYKIKVIKVNGKWMVDDVISPNESNYFDF